MAKDTKALVNFFFEAGHLAKTPRSFYQMLGTGTGSVAEHINRVVYIGYVLAFTEGDVDMTKVMQMCLFHDLAEARTSDLHYVHQKYVHSDEHKAIQELAATVPFGDELLTVLNEFSEKKTKEAILAKDADQLEFILSLKEQIDIGNTRAKTWVPSAVKRLQLEASQELAEEILQTNSDDWWFSNKEDTWWVGRDKKSLKKRF